MPLNRRIALLSIFAFVGGLAPEKARAGCCELPGGGCALGVGDESSCLAQGGVWDSGLICDGTECFKRIYVNANYAGSEDGASWSTPFSSLYSALSAVATFPTRSEIWVASGEYAADTGAFELPNHVAIIGGFRGAPGDEDNNSPTTRNADPRTNGTILSGELAGGLHASVIVLSNGNVDPTSIESFKVTGAAGHAIAAQSGSQARFLRLYIVGNNDNAQNPSGGAGMHVSASRVRLTDCIFEENHAYLWGGAILCEGDSRPEFIGCAFDHNTADFGGGAIRISDDCYPYIEACEFLYNESPGGFEGGAIAYYGGSAVNSARLSIRDCYFWGNSARDAVSGDGGAMSISGGTHDVEIVNNEIFYNTAGSRGGAIHIGQNGAETPPNVDVVNCEFVGNLVYSVAGSGPVEGGAAYVNQTATFTNCVFSANEAQDNRDLFAARGGAIMHAGGLLRTINCTFSDNKVIGGNLGGGLMSVYGDDASLVANCVFRNNSTDLADLEGTQIAVPDLSAPTTQFHVENSSIQFLNSLNPLAPEFELRQSVTAEGNHGAAPGFVNEFGVDGVAGTFDGEDLSLQSGSACIDVGDVSFVPDDVYNVDGDDDFGEKTPDIDLNPRQLPGAPAPVQVGCAGSETDLGAYEFADLDCNGTGGPDAIEIAACDADPECDDLDTNDDGVIDTCQDCDGNGVPDPDEINQPGALDLNENCILDKCEPDCNENGIPDDLDIANHTSDDCDQNGVPDSCDPDCNENNVPDGYDAPLPVDTKGREFILAFMPAYLQGQTPRVQLHLTADVETEVVVEYPMNMPGPENRIAMTVKPESVAVVRLPDVASSNWVAGEIGLNVVRVTADHDIRCVQVAGALEATDAALDYPVDALGAEYIIVTNTKSTREMSPDQPQFLVVATQDNTQVAIVPADELYVENGENHPAGIEIPLTLQRGQGFLAAGVGGDVTTSDLTGSVVTASKPVYVINGNVAANIPTGAPWADPTMETAPPVEIWGSVYVAANLPARGDDENPTEYPSYYRIVAAEDDTTILVDNTSVGTIDRGEFLDQTLSGDHVFASEGGQKIHVVQFMRSSNAVQRIGDPSQLNLTPSTLFDYSYEFSSNVDLVEGFDPQYDNHFISIIASDEDALLGWVTLDGDTVAPAEFVAIAGSGYKVATLKVEQGYHTTSSHVNGHSVVVGGWGTFDSYLYPAGATNIRLRGEDIDCDGNGLIDACEIQTTPGERVLYVDRVASGAGDGSDWANAFNSLQDAIAAAKASSICDRVGEIRVAQGSYRPDDGVNYTPGDRLASFELPAFVAIRGGYGGLQEPDPDLRDVANLKSILEGDIGAVGNASDNSEHIVVASNVDTTATLDGFLIINAFTEGEGGGLRIVNGSATIMNCRIEQNLAFLGGGMYCLYADPNVVNCRFVDNEGYLGAAASNWNASPTITNCLFARNSGIVQGAGGGGAVYNTNSNAVITNCTFADNESEFLGAGVYNYNAEVTLTNCVLWGNNSHCGLPTCPQFETQVTYEGTPGYPIGDVTYSCIEDDLEGDNVHPGVGNTDKNPVFQDNVDYRLGVGSSCIDAGDNLSVPADLADLDEDDDTMETTPVDLDGAPRFADDPEIADRGNGVAPFVDMGCYEFLAPGLVEGGSRMSHGGVSEYVIAPDGVEPRAINGVMTLTFAYDRPVYSADGDDFVTTDFTVINATISAVSQSPELDVIDVTLTGVTNASCVGLSFVVESVTGNEVTVDYTWRVLEGDVTGDGLVNKYDWSAIKTLNGVIPTKDQHRCDLDGDGVIEGSPSPMGDDYAIAYAASGDSASACTPEVTSIASRKTHLTTNYDIAPGDVEPRDGAMRIVFAFDREIRSADGDTLVAGDFTISSDTIVSLLPVKVWDEFVIEVDNITDGEVFTVAFEAKDLDGFPIQVEVCWPVLLGDVDGDGLVDATDAALVTAADGQALNASNFRCDLDADGDIEGVPFEWDDLQICEGAEDNEVGTCEELPTVFNPPL